MCKTFLSLSAASLLACIVSMSAFGQGVRSIPYKAETPDFSVLVKHLPDWEAHAAQATYPKNVQTLKTALGDRPVLDLIDFSGGTEAATAPYEAGKLLIVEYSTPERSIDADKQFTNKLAETNDPTTVYRRIGNYNAFVFDALDPTAANALLDQVKYEKEVQWLGKNPFRISPERAFVLGTSQLFLSTVLIVLIGVGIAISGGLISGYIFYTVRQNRRAAMPTFSDAGGMTRLNLDGLTPDILPKQLNN